MEKVSSVFVSRNPVTGLLEVLNSYTGEVLSVERTFEDEFVEGYNKKISESHCKFCGAEVEK
jgi:hypothetical protein